VYRAACSQQLLQQNVVTPFIKFSQSKQKYFDPLDQGIHVELNNMEV
jgi:hypothetical protein